MEAPWGPHRLFRVACLRKGSGVTGFGGHSGQEAMPVQGARRAWEQKVGGRWDNWDCGSSGKRKRDPWGLTLEQP